MSRDWWVSIERVEDKTPIREMLHDDVAAFLARGGQIEQAVSVTLRCVQSTDSHARTRVVWAADVASQSEADLHRPFNQKAPPSYGRDYLGAQLSGQQIRAGLKPAKVTE
jgi:hypothetical protein